MIHAVVRSGGVQLTDPLPKEWIEGQAVSIEAIDPNEASDDQIRDDFAMLQELCSTSDPDDEAALEIALRIADESAKDSVRRQMGLNW